MSHPTSPGPEPDAARPPGQPRRSLSSVASIVGLLALLGLMMAVFGPTLIDLFDFGPRRDAAIGQKLPDLRLAPLTGTEKPVTLDDLQGRVALVAFWGTWCGPCKREMPHLAEVAKRFASQSDFRFLAVSCGFGGPEDLAELQAETEVYLERAKLTIPTYADPELVTRRAFDSIGRLRGYPTTFLVDRQGVVRRVWVGYQPGIREELEQLVPALLKETFLGND